MSDLDQFYLSKAGDVFLGLTVDTTNIPGTPVASPQDVDLGKVDKVVMDAFNSRIAYAVIVFGGFAGFGEKRYAVPWSALQSKGTGRAFRLNLTQDDIDALPEYENDVWPDFTDDRWNRNVAANAMTTPPWMP